MELYCAAGRQRLRRKHVQVSLLTYDSVESERPFKAISRKKTLSRRLDDPECFHKLRKWLSDCLEEHIGCRQPDATWTQWATDIIFDIFSHLANQVGLRLIRRPSPNAPLPTRVIDVGCLGQDETCRLYITNGRHDTYVALSHCWGDPGLVPQDDISAVISVPRGNPTYHDCRRTFVDAIRTTREIDVRYLWIDALCIIQDSEEDWAIEAAKMSAVYRGAYLHDLSKL